MYVKTVGFFANPYKADVQHIANALLLACEKAGISVIVEPWLFGCLENGQCDVQACAYVGQNIDVMIVLGGDGTLLRAVPYAVRYNIPLFGINLGRIGFLTEIEPELINDDSSDRCRTDALENAMHALVDGAFEVESRMLLSVSAPGQEERLALNDVVLSRSGVGGVLALDAYLGQTLIDCYVADGLIVATPTGSTAYSLSAGGPIVAPDVSCLILAPICPHSLRARPMVFSPEGTVRLHVGVQQSAEVLLTTDGHSPFILPPDSDVFVRRALQEVRFVRLKERSFFDLLRTKLSEWSI